MGYRCIAIGAFFILCAPRLYGDDIPPTDPIWSGEGSVSYVQSTGNASSSTVGAGLRSAFEKEGWRAEGRAGFIRSEANNHTSLKRLDGSFRVTHVVSGKFSAYAQGAYLQDVFAGVRQQVIIDGGGLIKAVDKTGHELAFTVALIRTNEAKVISTASRQFWGSRTGLAWQYQANHAVLLGQEADYVHDFSRGSDWRISSISGLSVDMNKILALKASYQVRYRNILNPGVFHNTDTTFLVSVVARWPGQK